MQEINKTMTCKNWALGITVIGLIPLLKYILSSYKHLNIGYILLMVILLGVMVLFWSNNYKLELNEQKIHLYKIIGHNIQIDISNIKKVEIENIAERLRPHYKLFIYTENKIYEFGINSFRTREVIETLRDLANKGLFGFNDKSA